MSDAYSQHCADSAAEADRDDWEDWNRGVDYALRFNSVAPAAFTRHERLAAWSEGIGCSDAADNFAEEYHADNAEIHGSAVYDGEGI